MEMEKTKLHEGHKFFQLFNYEGLQGWYAKYGNQS